MDTPCKIMHPMYIPLTNILHVIDFTSCSYLSKCSTIPVFNWRLLCVWSWRYKSQQRRIAEHGSTPSVIIPQLAEGSLPLPPMEAASETVFLCRRVYDVKLKRILKNPQVCELIYPGPKVDCYLSQRGIIFITGCLKTQILLLRSFC